MTNPAATLPSRTSDALSVQVALDPSAIGALRSRLRGPVLLPGDPGYDDARSLWNATIDRRPALVIRCLGVADVVAAVEFVREHRLALTIKGGGHNISGLAVADGAVMLDMSLMRGVRVDPAARLAWAQVGCLLGDVDRETQLHGLAAPLGFVSTTGIAGLTLGGGFGYLTRRFGWTCDSVVAFDVVTADARVVRATETEHPDLFWALRGGGGNFGVVTGFTYRLAPVGPEILGGAIVWRADEAPRILDAFRTLAEEAPPELIAANERFYRAFESLDIKEMEAVWFTAAAVQCVHPGWGPLSGWSDVRDSWVRIFNNTSAMTFTPHVVHLSVVGEVAWLLCIEEITSRQADEEHASQILATNVFERRNGQWLLVNHHASPIFRVTQDGG